MLSFLYSPTFTSIHDHWKNHSLDYGQHMRAIIVIHDVTLLLLLWQKERGGGINEPTEGKKLPGGSSGSLTIPSSPGTPPH